MQAALATVTGSLLLPAILAGCTGLLGPAPLQTLLTFAPIAPPSIEADVVRTRSVPADIDASGTADAAAEIQAFFDRTPDNTRVTFPAGGEYRLSTGLILDGRQDLIIQGNGSKLLSDGCGADGATFRIGRGAPSSNIIIRGFDIVGANEAAGTGDAYQPECEHTHGVSIHQSSGIEIDDIDMSRVYGDCVYVGGGGFDRSTDVYFHDSSCRLNGRQGVAITAGDRVHVEDVEFDDIAIIAFDIEPNLATDGARDVVFTNNTVGSTGVSDRYRPMFFGANGNLDAEVRDVMVTNNVVSGSSMITLVGDEDKGWSGGRNHYDIVFVGNRSPVEAQGPVLIFKHVDGLTIYGNEQPLESGSLVRLFDVVNATAR